MSELINGYVDVTADDWVFMVNAGLDFAPVWAMNIRGSNDIITFGLFMNQPIVDEFIYQKQIKQSAFRNTSDAKSVRYESNLYYNTVRKRLKKASKLPNRMLDEPLLASMVGMSLESMNNDQLAIQLQVLKMLQAQMSLANDLSDVHKVTAYDTNTPKDRSSIMYREVLRKVMQEKSIFTTVNGRDAITSILELPVLKGFNEATHAFPRMFKGLFVTEAIEEYSQVAENFIRQGIKEGIAEEQIIYRLNRFENFIITHTLHNSTLQDPSDTTLKSRAKYLMQGLSSLPRRVVGYKKL